jgi:cytochrome c oxidase subunit II
VHSRQWSWIFEYENHRKSPDLVVPMGKNIRCFLVSDDVIHGFYIPAFRIQQDTVPGIKTQVWFNATTTGNYDILCAQYCGLRHSSMLARLIVVQPDKFDAWMKGENINFPDKFQSEEMPVGEKLLFERGCISCHSLGGGLMAGPTFKGIYGSTSRVKTAGRMRDVTVDDKYLIDSIINPGLDVVDGFPNTMPSGRDVLTDQEINEIIAYLKTLK